MVLESVAFRKRRTQSCMLAKHVDVPRVSSGDVLRERATADTEIGQKIAGYRKRGDLVPDDLTIAAIRDALGGTLPSGGGTGDRT